jgi:N-acyl-D-amino-acid deacylase
VASYFDRLEKEKMSLNQAFLVGQGTLRSNAVGLVNRPLTSDELSGVLRAVEEGMDQGAVGVSSGLEYVPGSYTPTEEIVAMARIVARRGGVYATHIRDEGTNLLAAVNEAITIGKQTGVRVEISHFKSAGRPNWNKQEAAIHLVESARRSGISVLADAYPYHAYSTGLMIYIPGWAQEGGSRALVERLKDTETKSKIAAEVEAAIANDPGSYEAIVIAGTKTERNRVLLGKNLEEVASEWRISPLETLMKLVEEEEGNVSFVGFGIDPENVEKVLSHPLVMVGSDGLVMAPRGSAAESQPHPRSYGTCPRVLGYYCREHSLFDLPTAIKKMTSIPADQIGLSDRGRIAKGKKADLVVFDPETVIDTASFSEPHQYPMGVPYVVVNGVLVVDKNKHTGEKPGRVLRA